MSMTCAIALALTTVVSSSLTLSLHQVEGTHKVRELDILPSSVVLDWEEQGYGDTKCDLYIVSTAVNNSRSQTVTLGIARSEYVHSPTVVYDVQKFTHTPTCLLLRDLFTVPLRSSSLFMPLILLTISAGGYTLVFINVQF